MLPTLTQNKLISIARLAASGMDFDGLTREIERIAGEGAIAVRIAEWLPEAFGYILISNFPGLKAPKTFHAKGADGEWREISFEKEPLFKEFMEVASTLLSLGERDVFEKIAVTSSSFAAVNNALNDGKSLSNADISGPAFVRLPAEYYFE